MIRIKRMNTDKAEKSVHIRVIRSSCVLSVAEVRELAARIVENVAII
jgi:hypothetical protein